MAGDAAVESGSNLRIQKVMLRAYEWISNDQDSIQGTHGCYVKWESFPRGGITWRCRVMMIVKDGNAQFRNESRNEANCQSGY